MTLQRTHSCLTEGFLTWPQFGRDKSRHEPLKGEVGVLKDVVPFKGRS